MKMICHIILGIFLKLLGKRWGNPEGKPVLCLHGWLDNSCSFDPLAPLLPNDKFDFVALDFNGHGFSSHYPPGMTYRFSDSFTVVKNIKEYFNWDKFTFLGWLTIIKFVLILIKFK